MTITGQPAGEARLEHRHGDHATGCGGCGHPFALHSNGKTECKAFACTAGPDDGPCQEFVAAADKPGEPARLAS
jgi:hypothetical protein